MELDEPGMELDEPGMELDEPGTDVNELGTDLDEPGKAPNFGTLHRCLRVPDLEVGEGAVLAHGHRYHRRHWDIENKCHPLLDVTYLEDPRQVPDRLCAQNFTLLREISTKLLRDNR